LREALRSYHWPGNVRELRNVVIRVAVLAQGSEVRTEDLPCEWKAGPPGGEALPEGSLDSLERRAIFEVLTRTGGHHQRTAELLGISRRTLSRKLKLYSVEEAATEPP
jgi:DNA-binding NtrC family response regulator